MRYCQTLDLKEDPRLIEEYRRLHSPEGVWPEIIEGIRSVGINEMEIFLLGTRLVMIIDTPDDFDWDTAMARLATLPKQAEWELLTGKYQEAKVGATSDEKWQMMEKIFHLYNCE